MVEHLKLYNKTAQHTTININKIQLRFIFNTYNAFTF